MIHAWRSKLGLVTILIGGGLALSKPVFGQPVPDNTLGEESSRVIDLSERDFVIDGGARRGNNLFHSFREINVEERGSVYFFDPGQIENIFTRVTGENPSNINGVLGTFGIENGAPVGSNANLYLINPNGIVFGPNARLNVQGSFVGTTANAISFGDQGFFSTIDSVTSLPLLTVNPSAFLFNQIPVGNIVVNSSMPNITGGNTLNLQVLNGQNLLLLGGSVSINGGRLNASGGHIQIAGVADVGAVEIYGDGNLSFPEDMTRADILFTNRANFDVRSRNGGSITVNARNIDILGESSLRAGILPGFGSVESQAGNINLNATGTVNIGQSSEITNIVGTNASGTGGNIGITANRISLTNSSFLGNATDGNGRGGAISVNVNNSFIVDGNSTFGTLTFSQQNAGDITIDAGDLQLLNNSRLSTGTVEQGNAGNLEVITRRVTIQSGSFLGASAFSGSRGRGGNLSITASESVEVVGATQDNQFVSGIVAETEGSEDAANLQITTARLIIRDGGTVSVETSGAGDGGTLTINASEIIEITGGTSDNRFSSSLSAETEGAGNAGLLAISTRRLVLRDGGFVSVDARQNSTGNAGNLIVNATDSIDLIGTTPAGDNPTGISVAVLRGATGNAGLLTIETGRLRIRDGAGILAQNFGSGEAGSIRIDATDLIEVIGGNGEPSVINATVGADTTGQPGNINLQTQNLRLLNGGQIVAATYGSVNAGNIRIRAIDSIEISGTSADRLFPSGIVATSIPQIQGNAGRAGNINISTRSLHLQEEAEITASTFGQADAGNIIVNASDAISLDRSTISTRVNQSAIGNGGDIQLDTDTLTLNNEAEISAQSTGQGNAGNIVINAEEQISIANSNITTQAEDSTGGAITVTGRDIRLWGDSDIRTEVEQGAAGGGDITINADSLIAFDDSDIIAAAADGRGGNINFGGTIAFFENYDPNAANADPDTLEGNNRADINATGATPGIISLPDTSFIQNSLTDLEENIVDADSLIANSCIARIENGGTFLITGSGGLPPRPGVAPLSPYPAGEVRTGLEADDSSWKPGDAIEEPQGVYQLPDGQLVMSRECP